MRAIWLMLLCAPFLLFGDSGFYSARSYRVPSAVEQAGNSVVKLIMLDSESKQPQLSGSAFVVEDSKTLWTAAHVILNPRQAGQNIELYILDSVGQKIFDTRNGDSAILSLIGPENNGNSAPSSHDYAKIVLSRPLNLKPLSLNTSIPPLGEYLYSVGYPAIDSIDEVNSQTITLGVPQSRVTMGKAIASETADTSIVSSRLPALFIEAVKKELSNKLIYMDSDGYFGQSGSPILNDSGEVVGIFTNIIRTRGEGAGVQIETKGFGPSFHGILSE